MAIVNTPSGKKERATETETDAKFKSGLRMRGMGMRTRTRTENQRIGESENRSWRVGTETTLLPWLMKRTKRWFGGLVACWLGGLVERPGGRPPSQTLFNHNRNGLSANNNTSLVWEQQRQVLLQQYRIPRNASRHKKRQSKSYKPVFQTRKYSSLMCLCLSLSIKRIYDPDSYRSLKLFIESNLFFLPNLVIDNDLKHN